MRLPRRVCFPFGYTVKVKMLSDKQMLDSLDEESPEDGVDGYWDVDDRTIRIRKKISQKRKVYILLHECLHALHDMTHQLLDEGKAKP